MKLSSKVKLITGKQESAVLSDTLRVSNHCCDWISGQAWKHKIFGTFALHKLTYAQARSKFGLSAQMVVRCIGKVADAYKLDKKSRREFAQYGAIAYDDRILSWDIENQTFSIWTVAGRKRLEFKCGERQLGLLASRQGETDLILQRGIFYLAATCNVDEPDPADIDSFLGVDFGVSEIASTSDGKSYSGSAIKAVRFRHRRLRAKLQRKQTRAAKRRLKKLSGKESRFAKHTNHVISKQIVEDARRTKQTIVLEELTGIRSRIRARRDQRAVLHGWAFAQLRQFIAYKAALAGVSVIFVDPRNTSRECSQCGHVDKPNRPSQSVFSCRQCGFTENADLNAALVIGSRAKVNWPYVPCAASGGLQSQAQSYRLSAG